MKNILLLLLLLSSCVTSEKAEKVLLESGDAAAFCARNFPVEVFTDSTVIAVETGEYKKLMAYVDSLDRQTMEYFIFDTATVIRYDTLFKALRDRVRTYRADTVRETRYQTVRDKAAEDSLTVALKKAEKEAVKVSGAKDVWKKIALVSGSIVILSIIGIVIKILK